MNRRRFLWFAGGSGALLLGGGGWWAKTAFTRSNLTTQLLREAMPLLTKKDDDERRTLPVSAREAIRTWFHAPCLNSAEFAREICSLPFRERVRTCSTTEMRQQFITDAFFRKVVSNTEIDNRVRSIAVETGARLDQNWTKYCSAVASEWNSSLKLHETSLLGNLSSDVNELVRQKLNEAINQAKVAGELPALSETLSSIGRSAILALRLVRIPVVGPFLVVPVFLLNALGPTSSFITSIINNPASDIQAAVSHHLADLANHVGAAFETEVRARLSDLHRWQQEAMEQAAGRQAHQAISIL